MLTAMCSVSLTETLAFYAPARNNALFSGRWVKISHRSYEAFLVAGAGKLTIVGCMSLSRVISFVIFHEEKFGSVKISSSDV